jgi:DNA gyrase subunit A
VVRRTKFELNKARRRAHILVGLLVALDYIDKVITLIRASKTPEEARIGLMEGKFIEDLDGFWSKFSDLIETRTEEQVLIEGNVLTLDQAKAILDMRLQKLTGLERDKIKAEYDELMLEISRLEDILNSKELQRSLIKGELEVIKEQYGDDRRTEINYSDGDISLEDMIPQEDVVVTISSLGYVKRTAVSEYRTQSRGGRGAMGAKTRDADFVEHMIVANTHSYMMLFTEKGKCFWLKVYEIPEATKTSSGRVIQNILSIPKDDKVKAYILVDNLSEEEYINNHYILFATKKGLVKKTILEAYSRPRVGGINAISINEDDQLLEAILTTGNSEVIIANKSGNAIRFNESAVRSMGRTATGVRGIRLAENNNDEVIGMISFDAEDTETAVMVVSEKGNGKRTAFADYRLTNRGGKGVRNMMVTDKTGPVVSIKAVLESDDLMITTRSGVTIRSKVSEIRIMGRSTQGVRIIRLDQSDSIADVAVIAEDTESDQNAEENEQNENDQNTNEETNNE